METEVIALFNDLVSNNVWWNSPPGGMQVDGEFIILQRIGGKTHWYIDGTRPDTSHGRVQVWVWGKDPGAVSAINKQIVARLAGVNEFGHDVLKAVAPYGDAVGDYDAGAELHGLRQQFGLSYLNL